MKTTKSEISKVFSELRKFGFLVFNFNSDKKFNRGAMRGFVDHLIIGKNCVWFLEVKIGKDILSPEQIDLLTQLKILEDRTDVVKWYLVPGVEVARQIKEYILEKG